MRCAILDDYQNVALKLADWVRVSKAVDIKVFDQWIPPAEVPEALKGFEIVCAMRERTRFPQAGARGIARPSTADHRPACATLQSTSRLRTNAASSCAGRAGSGNPTAGIAIGLMLELTRHIGYENARLKAGAPWQIDDRHRPRRQDAGRRRIRQARDPGRQYCQGVRHERHCVEPKPDAGEMRRSGCDLRQQGGSVSHRRHRLDPSHAQRSLARA